MHLTKTCESEDLQSILKRLRSYRKKRREEALAAARQLSTDQLISLVTAATRHIRRINRRDWTFYPPFWIMLGMPAAALLLSLLHESLPFDFNTAIGVDMVIAVFIPLVIMFYDMAINPTQRYMACLLYTSDAADE